jgi:hypothetical protein
MFCMEVCQGQLLDKYIPVEHFRQGQQFFFSLMDGFHTVSGSRRASYPVGTGDKPKGHDADISPSGPKL